jgi:hypothetical protein
MKTETLFGLYALLACVSLVAQQVIDPLESLREIRASGPSGTVVQASGGLTGPGDVRLLDASGAVLAATALPMQHPMWVACTAVAPCRYLIGGTGFDASSGARVGWMARVEVPDAADAVSVVGSVVHADVWPVEAVIADRSLVFIDGKTRRILATPVGHTVFADLPQAQVVATTAALPSLSMPGGVAAARLHLSASGSVHYVCLRGRSEQGVITQTGGGWACTPMADVGSVNDPFVANGFFGFEVKAPPQAQGLEVRDLAQLHAAACQPGWCTVPPIPFLVQRPEASVVVKFTGAPTGDLRVHPTLRYGKPLSISDIALGNIHMPKIMMLPADRWGLRADARCLSGNQQRIAVLSLAVRGPDGTDPVVHNVGPNGQQAFLDAQATFAFDFASGNVLDGIGAGLWSLADDPAHDGTVLLGQIIVFGSNDEIGITDITCTVLKSSAASQSAAAVAPEGSGVASHGAGASSLFGPGGAWAPESQAAGSQAASAGAGVSIPAAMPQYQAARQRFLSGM